MFVPGRRVEPWLARVAGIKQWQSAGLRAPHKPLLLLSSLARLERGESTQVHYETLAPRLLDWLEKFGPPRKKQRPEYPFWYLQSDGLWTVSVQNGGAIAADSKSWTPTHRRLVDAQAIGQLSSDFEEALRNAPELRREVALLLLDDNWPRSLHADVCTSLDLQFEFQELDLARSRAHALRPSRRRRDSQFREAVLQSYNYACAMCGYRGHLDDRAIALEAAHVRWHANRGPDRTDNGLCLCSIHHKLFDGGALGIAEDSRIVVSKRFCAGSSAAHRMVSQLHGQELRQPASGSDRLCERHRRWHQREVFRGPAR